MYRKTTEKLRYIIVIIKNNTCILYLASVKIVVEKEIISLKVSYPPSELLPPPTDRIFT